MKNFKIIFIIALAIIFVVTAFTAIFNAGRILGQVFKVYVFKYQDCEYKVIPIEVAPNAIPKEQPSIRECSIDYNGAKREIAEGLALLIVSIPIAYISQSSLRKNIKEAKNKK
ncbi:MAG TPA: hypothetical protein VMW82_01420 [Candidatus Paceibacterota bacterium]|nr:hypothetical protein [Candidatus Paceibacterota bacterium]